MTDWQRIYTDVEDRLLPHFQLDIWERGLYFYLLRHTRLAGLESIIIPLPVIASALRCSEWQARKVIRALAEKGCIELEQTRRGHKSKFYSRTNWTSLTQLKRNPIWTLSRLISLRIVSLLGCSSPANSIDASTASVTFPKTLVSWTMSYHRSTVVVTAIETSLRPAINVIPRSRGAVPRTSSGSYTGAHCLVRRSLRAGCTPWLLCRTAT